MSFSTAHSFILPSNINQSLDEVSKDNHNFLDVNYKASQNNPKNGFHSNGTKSFDSFKYPKLDYHYQYHTNTNSSILGEKVPSVTTNMTKKPLTISNTDHLNINHIRQYRNNNENHQPKILKETTRLDPVQYLAKRPQFRYQQCPNINFEKIKSTLPPLLKVSSRLNREMIFSKHYANSIHKKRTVMALSQCK